LIALRGNVEEPAGRQSSRLVAEQLRPGGVQIHAGTLHVRRRWIDATLFVGKHA
jgi:hypothetical protein